MFREMLRRICSETPDIDVVVEAENGLEAVRSIISFNPEAVLLDLLLPGLDGFEVIRQIRKTGRRPRVLAISGDCSPYLVFRLEQAEVQGFIDKRTQTLATVREALCALQANRAYFSNRFLKLQSQLRRDPKAFAKLLTRQQMTVLSLVAEQLTDSVIARRLGVEARTVEAHRTIIMRKLDLHSRVDLIHFACAQGFIMGLPSAPE